MSHYEDENEVIERPISRRKSLILESSESEQSDFDDKENSKEDEGIILMLLIKDQRERKGKSPVIELPTRKAIINTPAAGIPIWIIKQI